jgi:hypothetical protein
MNNGTILELAKKADLVGPHYTPEMGNVSWPRLKEFAELVETRTLAEAHSAAPELLVALQDLVSGLDATSWSSWQTTAKFSGEIEAARAAITKARGEA